MVFKIALRAIFRNQRRSLMTVSTITVGAVAALVFGAYVVFILVAIETGTVRSGGHLTVYRRGYFEFGAANPSTYGIENYTSVVQVIRDDPEVQARLVVATPVQAIMGIASNSDTDTSKPFFGIGYIPSERERMRQWDPYGVGGPVIPLGFTDAEPSFGLIGTGMGRILGLCQPLHIDNCPPPPNTPARRPQDAESASATRPTSIVVRNAHAANAAPSIGQQPRIDLLAAAAGGAPNIVTMSVVRAASQGSKEADDSYVAMSLSLAQHLLYGQGEPRVSGIVLQLRRTDELDFVRQRLIALFEQHHLDLEIKDYQELNPYYTQVVALFFSIFVFIAVIIGIVVLFTVTNTVGMSVMERAAEIGTVRALGVRRSGVRWQFLVEGWLLGVIGATAGVILAAVIVYGINHSGLTWTPPGNSRPEFFQLDLFTRKSLVAGTWLGLIAVATVSAVLPANRAARLKVVDALRHV